MKIIQPNNTKKVALIISIAVLITCAVVGLMFYYRTGPFSQQGSTSIDLSDPTDEEIDTGTETKKQTLDQASDKSNSVGSDPSPAPQPIEGSDKKSVGMEITAANQDESALHIRTLIQTITSSGTCTITITNPTHATYTASVPVQALSSTSTCKGFDIPLDALASGTWSVTVDFANTELTGSTTKSVDIK